MKSLLEGKIVPRDELTDKEYRDLLSNGYEGYEVKEVTGGVQLVPKDLVVNDPDFFLAGDGFGGWIDALLDIGPIDVPVRWWVFTDPYKLEQCSANYLKNSGVNKDLAELVGELKWPSEEAEEVYQDFLEELVTDMVNLTGPQKLIEILEDLYD